MGDNIKKNNNMAHCKKIAPEGGGQEKLIHLRDLRVNRLFLSIFCLLCIPGVSFLERGIRTNVGCSNDFDSCTARCAEIEKALLFAIRAGTKRMDDESQRAQVQCPLDCASVSEHCKSEAQLQIVAVVLICCAFLCTMWLFKLVLNLLRLDEESKVGLSTKKEEKVPKRRVAIVKGPQGEREASESPARGLSEGMHKMTHQNGEMAKLIAMGVSDEKIEKYLFSFAENAKDEPVICSSCDADIPKAYIQTRPMISWTTSCLASAPLYCPKCYNVQYGFV